MPQFGMSFTDDSKRARGCLHSVSGDLQFCSQMLVRNINDIAHFTAPSITKKKKFFNIDHSSTSSPSPGSSRRRLPRLPITPCHPGSTATTPSALPLLPTRLPGRSWRWPLPAMIPKVLTLRMMEGPTTIPTSRYS